MSERLPEKPWASPADDVAEQLGVRPDVGLSAEEVAARRATFGENVLRRTASKPALGIFIDQFRSLLVGLLAVGSVVSFAFGEYVDAGAILAVVIINAAIGFWTELRAVREMEALRELGDVQSVVRRDGRLQAVRADELVPGDIVVVEGGDVVTADVRLVEASRLQADESTLTGESIASTKSTGHVAPGVDLADHDGMLYKGTAITRGRGAGVVVATGMETELGRITKLVQEAGEDKTPLEKRLDRLGRVLAYVSLGFVVVVALAGLASGKPFLLVMQTAIALLVATVPEGLPIVATIALARGMSRMAAQNALLDELSAVETLGSTNIILTDKTGTLTENQMTVRYVVGPDAQYEVTGLGLSIEGEFLLDGEPVEVSEHDDLSALLVAAALCTDASFDEEGSVGDPMELALLVAARKAGWSKDRLEEEYPRIEAEAFDPVRRMMATIHRAGGDVLYAVKGAPEAVLAVCDMDERERSTWAERNTTLASEGLRLLAIARKLTGSPDEDAYHGLELLGMTALVDPPRADVRDAIEACHDAGIRVVMVTGDQAPTAANIAAATGLARADGIVMSGREMQAALDAGQLDRVRAADVVARSSPEQKLALIDTHQETGAVVAMIGDGVNDAPALRKADIGVAMGQRGTQVAREAAEMVLRDDRFQTIVYAIHEGRVIFRNIRTFVLYLISCNLSEIIVIGSVAMFNAPLPLLPLQILFLNLVTDVFPALALGVGEGDETIMKHPPREPGEPVLTGAHWRKIFAYGSLLAASVLAAYLITLLGLGWEDARVVTISFLTLAVGQLFHVFNMASSDSGIFDNEVTRNPWVWGALALCTVLILGAAYMPGLRDVLGVRPPELLDWGIILGFAAVPMVVGRLWAWVRR